MDSSNSRSERELPPESGRHKSRRERESRRSREGSTMMEEETKEPLQPDHPQVKYAVVPAAERERATGKVEDVEGNQPPPARDEWGHSMQFFFTVLGFCVGLGNIWRFPYLCQKNGGGAFVIPFLIMIVVEGMPLMLLELAVGQKFRRGSYIVWNQIHPWIGGIGLGSTVIAVVVGCYYNVIIAWCLYYLIMSIRPSLPWSSCPEIKYPEDAESAATPSAATSITDAMVSSAANTSASLAAAAKAVVECDRSSETQYFWYREALDITDSIEDADGVRWWMFLCLTASWVVVYFIIMKGIQSSGKVVYFTALFPYVVLTIFFVRGLTLKGAGAGLAHMFHPDMEKLMTPMVWLDAANQVFYSFGIAFGSIIGFGSYNPVNKNCVKDVYIISACNAFTAVYGCAVVFAILGFKAQHLFEKCIEEDLNILEQCEQFRDLVPHNLTVSAEEYASVFDACASSVAGLGELRNCSLEAELNEAAQGTGLAFIVMADVFTKLPGAPFWSFLFFAMLLTLGLGSQIGILEGVMGTLFDMPQLQGYKKPVLSGLGCLICFLIGILFVTGAGEYWLTLFDKYGAMGLTLIAFSEIVAVSYVYGHRRFTEDIYKMTGVRPGLYWQLTWRLLAPVLIAVILVSSVVSELLKKPSYEYWDQQEAHSVKTDYPTWCLVIAFFLAIASVVPIVLICLLRMCGLRVLPINMTTSRSDLQRVETCEKPMMPPSNVPSFHDLDKNESDRKDKERASDQAEH